MSINFLSAATQEYADVPEKRLSVLVLYDIFSTYIETVREYIESFLNYSKHHICYAWATHNAPCLFDLAAFDVVIIHYSVRVSVDWLISPSFAEALPNFAGLKVLIIQDEYDTTEQARIWIEKLGIDIVLTCVPPEYIDCVYPRKRFPNVCFVQTLTGFLPNNIKDPKTIKPLAERKIDIGYRGRPLAYYYGDLAREKLVIGQRMRELCSGRDIVIDIEWTEEARIYGDKWYDFLENCKATLGTESGANIFDDHGQIRETVKKALTVNPRLSYEEAHNLYLAEHEGKVKMNQVSPRIFEAIAHRTALILFEGSYSGVVMPDIHYIPLKKDFSNLDEVILKLKDNAYLESMIERAYKDIVLSGQYTYSRFIADVDRLIVAKWIQLGKLRPAGIGYLNKSIYVAPSALTETSFTLRHRDDLITSLVLNFPFHMVMAFPIVWFKQLKKKQFPGRYYIVRGTKKLLSLFQAKR